MSMFYDLIEQDIKDESRDNNKYLELAKIAPTEKARKILTDIAHEESMHHKYLQEILNDRVSTSEVKNNNDSHTQLHEGYELDYPTHIENVGVDPDELSEIDNQGGVLNGSNNAKERK